MRLYAGVFERMIRACFGVRARVLAKRRNAKVQVRGDGSGKGDRQDVCIIEISESIADDASGAIDAASCDAQGVLGSKDFLDFDF